MFINTKSSGPGSWSPPGMKIPKKTPTSVVALSRNLKHLEVTGEKDEAFRCPICGVPYESSEAMQICINQPYDRTLRKDIGLDAGDGIAFIALDRRGKRVRRSGHVHAFVAIRSPRGHEDMLVVRWMNGVDMLESVLIPEPPQNVLLAIPQFTRNPLKTRAF